MSIVVRQKAFLIAASSPSAASRKTSSVSTLAASIPRSAPRSRSCSRTTRARSKRRTRSVRAPPLCHWPSGWKRTLSTRKCWRRSSRWRKSKASFRGERRFGGVGVGRCVSCAWGLLHVFFAAASGVERWQVAATCIGADLKPRFSAPWASLMTEIPDKHCAVVNSYSSCFRDSTAHHSGV